MYVFYICNNFMDKHVIYLQSLPVEEFVVVEYPVPHDLHEDAPTVSE